MPESRTLGQLHSVGATTVEALELLGIHSVEQLATCDAEDLYARLCRAKSEELDICAQDVFQAAIAQARNPNLPPEQHDWWYWSQRRIETRPRSRG